MMTAFSISQNGLLPALTRTNIIERESPSNQCVCVIRTFFWIISKWEDAAQKVFQDLNICTRNFCVVGRPPEDFITRLLRNYNRFTLPGYFISKKDMHNFTVYLCPFDICWRRVLWKWKFMVLVKLIWIWSCRSVTHTRRGSQNYIVELSIAYPKALFSEPNRNWVERAAKLE